MSTKHERVWQAGMRRCDNAQYENWYISAPKIHVFREKMAVKYTAGIQHAIRMGANFMFKYPRKMRKSRHDFRNSALSTPYKLTTYLLYRAYNEL